MCILLNVRLVKTKPSERLILHALFLFAEIEAKEVCDWLRAAGFPQYAQIFKGKYLSLKLPVGL